MQRSEKILDIYVYPRTFSHRTYMYTCAHGRTHHDTDGHVYKPVANGPRDIGRHVRSILPNGSSNFHFAPVMPTYVCPPASCLASLFRSSSPFCLLLTLLEERIHPRGTVRGRGERRVRKGDRENLLTSRIALIFHPCKIASAAHLPDD